MGKQGTNQKKTSAVKDLNLDFSNMDRTVGRKDPPGTKYRCTCCGTFYPKQDGYFSVSFSPLYAGNNGYVHICKPCSDSYYQQLVGYFRGREDEALERCCGLFDWYFTQDCFEMLRKIPPNRSKVNAYPSRMGLVAVKDKGTCYLDTIRDKIDAKGKIMNAEDVAVHENSEEPTESGEKASSDVISFFGYGYTNDEYVYLERQYVDWTTRYECKTKAQEELFKSLCLSQLMQQKASLGGSTKEMNEAMKTFQELLGTANLKPNQNKDNALVDQNTFGTLIKRIENERPIGEPDEEWRDVDGIKSYVETFFLGHLCNLVHVKNDYSDKYLDEMEKYTVKPPVYEEDDEYNETSLLDKYSDKGTKE